MTTKKYATRINIEIDTVGNPDYIIRLNAQVIDANISVELDAGKHTLEVEHLNKQATDSITAVVIKRITFNDITSDKVLWAGIYYPSYPEPWASEQRQLGNSLADCLPTTNYLGWNGVWRLEFTAPIFTWIHEVEGLGWIYK